MKPRSNRLLSTPIPLLLLLALVWALPVSVEAVRLYSPPRVRLLPIGIAPRSFVRPLGSYLYFTEKKQPPHSYYPGAVRRILYRVPLRGKASIRKVALLGNVFIHPILDAQHKRIFFCRRTRDSNQDGKLGFHDNRVVYQCTLGGKKLRRLSSPAHDTRLLAYNPDTQTLLLARKRILLELGLNAKRKRLRKRARLKHEAAAAFYDQTGTPFIVTAQGVMLQLDRKGRLHRAGRALLYRSGDIALWYSQQRKKNRYLKLWKDKQVYSFPTTGLKYLLALDRERDILLDTTPGKRRLFAAHGLRKAHQDIYRFPANTTRVGFSSDRLTAAFLVTFDSDKDGRLSPGGLDKSAVYFMRIGKD